MARRRRKGSGNSSIKTFTAKGSAAPGTLGTFAPSPLGHFDPTTGRVYQHPRVRNSPITAGSRVEVTNPAATGPRARERTRSVGMGGIGQTGRTVGIPGGPGD
jgi:hypothetical protein